MGKIKHKENELVSKSNQLVEATYRLTLQEQRLLAFMIAEIKLEDKDFKSYRFRISDFCDLLDLPKDRYYSELKLTTRKLLTRTLQIKKANSTLQLTWLSSAEYFEKQGYLELCFDPKLKPYLLQLKDCFTQYQLINILKLRSKYAFRIYELLKQYQTIGKRKFALKELRELLGLKKEELKQWIDFKRKVLEISKREINKKTDIQIDYETEKVGRKIEYIIFTIKNQEQGKHLEEDKRYTELLKLIPKKYRNLKTIRNSIIKYLQKKGFKYVERNIKYANERAESNYRVYLINSLKKDWAEGWWEEKQEEQNHNKLKQKQRAKDREEYLKRIKPYIGKKVRIATITALTGIIQKDGSLLVETARGKRIYSAQEIQQFLKEKDVIEEVTGKLFVPNNISVK